MANVHEGAPGRANGEGAPQGAAPGIMHRDKDNLLRRLRRIEGQIRGLQRMVDEDKYCVDILVQVAAARAALNKVGLMLLEDHTRGCVAGAIAANEAEPAIDELMDVIHRFLR